MIQDETERALKPFERVATALKSRIMAGDWRPGILLPGRRTLADEYEVAGPTLERAIALLSAEGLITIVDRRGTFVAETADAEAPTPPFTARPMPSPAAPPLTATIGIVAPACSSGNAEEDEAQWQVKILHGCEHRLAADPGLTSRSVKPCITGSISLLAATTEAVTRLMDERVNAIILIGSPPLSPDFIARHAAIRTPIVFASFERGDHPFPQVYIDNMAAGAAAARHLLTRGYPRLLYFQPFAATWSDERLAGVRSVLGASAADPARLRVLPDRSESALLPNQRDHAHQRAREVLASDDWAPRTGVIAVNDYAAEEFARVAAERGLVAGCDYGLVGFDDRARERGLTSLRPPLEELGKEAAGLAVRLLRGEAPPLRIALQYRVIARTSSRGQEELGVRR